MAPNFSKANLVESLALHNDIESAAAASRVVEHAIEVITEQVASGKAVNISGLGKFVPELRPARDTNFGPAPEKVVVKFRPSATFSRKVAGE